MVNNAYRLEVSWVGGEPTGRMQFALFNLGDAALSGFTLCFTTLTRIADASRCENMVLIRRNANFHEVAPPEGLVLERGAAWRFTAAGLTRNASHRTDGVSTAYLSLADGAPIDISCGDLQLADAAGDMAPVLVPEGRVAVPVAVLPWPRSVELGDFGPAPVALFPAKGSGLEAMRSVSEAAALSQRLFPGDRMAFALDAVAGGLPVRFNDDTGIAAEGYRLSFVADGIDLASSGKTGRFYGLVSLAQMLRGAWQKPDVFKFPRQGTISDQPRYSWRGCHLDVSRQVYAPETVARFVDILAWNKMNVLHWHLSDDEGWRLEIKAFPELTEIGAKRGPGEKLTAQLGTGAEVSAGFYTQDEVRGLIAHGQKLAVGILPEIDIPGHSAAMLAAIRDLGDPQEAPESYHSVQGYANNAINPALALTYDVIDTIIGEIAALFPFEYIHIGGDEVADGAWLASPLAKALMRDKGLSGTAELQAYFLKQVQEMIIRRGKKLSGWDEVSHGGGVDPAGTLLMAWQKPEVGIGLAEMGYDVVMTPGQAYYLDMVQSPAWLEPGLTWAGISPPEHCYGYEAAGDFPDALLERLKGVQGCIWSENMTSKARFNHMVFPRLGAIAEAGWTPKAGKDWLRFAAISKLMPRL